VLTIDTMDATAGGIGEIEMVAGVREVEALVGRDYHTIFGGQVLTDR